MLTPRESEIMALAAQGFTHKEIADKLGISPKTVGTHVQFVYRKYDVPNCTAAAVEYTKRRLGFGEDSPP
jgi:DNA-binding CsgD family transcriptional regulator